MNKQPHRFSLSRQALTIVVLLVVILILVALRQNELWVERYYYGGVYQWFSYVLHPALRFLAFSIGDILYTLAVLLLAIALFSLVRLLFIKQPEKTGRLALRFIIYLEIAWLWFYCFWGMNYYRPPAARLLGLNDTTYTLKDVAKVTQLIIDSANACRARLDTADLHQSNAAIYQHAVAAVNQLGATSNKFRAIAPRVKPSMYSCFLNYMGTSGYFNPFTGEAQLNYLMPVFDKPFVACHEMGHQSGWAREDEANFAGFAAGTQANDRLLRYSAYYAGIEEFMRYLRRRDTTAHRALRRRISPLVIHDFKADSAYWTKYQGGTEVAFGLVYDKFLKANNQPRGLRTYNRMILLTMAYYRKRYRVW